MYGLSNVRNLDYHSSSRGMVQYRWSHGDIFCCRDTCDHHGFSVRGRQVGHRQLVVSKLASRPHTDEGIPSFCFDRAYAHHVDGHFWFPIKGTLRSNHIPGWKQ